MNLLGLIPFFAGGRGGVVTLSGATGANQISASTEFGVAGIRVNTDGTIDKLEDGVTTQLSSGTDWIIPNILAKPVYQVRVTSVTDTGGSGEAWESAPAADDAWVDLSSNRTWSVANIGEGGSNTNGRDFTLEIRYGVGPVLASASYSLLSEYFV